MVANYQPLPIILEEPRPQGTKQFHVDHHNAKGKEAASKAMAKATIDFATTTLNKVEHNAHHNTFSLFTFKDNLITYDLAQ